MKIISMKGLVEKASGKVCQDDNNSVSYRKKDGKMFSVRRCHVRDLEKNPYTERELAIHTSFTEKSKIASAWTRANRRFMTNSDKIDLNGSTEAYRKMRAAFDAQDKIATFQAFVWNHIQDGAVVVPDVDIEGSSSAGSNASGGANESGGSTSTGGSQTPQGGSEQGSTSQNPDTDQGSEDNSGSDVVGGGID